MNTVHIDWLDEAGHPLVAIHGLPQAPESLIEGLPNVRGWRRGVAHMPGYGHSPLPTGTYDFASVNDATWRQVPSGPVVLVGMSGGAYRVLMMALQNPERVRGLVLIAPATGPADQATRMQFLAFRDMLTSDADLSEVARGRWLTAEEASDPRAASVLNWLHAAPRVVMARECEAYAGAEDLRPRLSEIQVPVLLIAGDEDLVAPPDLVSALAERFPNGRRVRIPNAGHALTTFHGREVAAAIETFLGSVSVS